MKQQFRPLFIVLACIFALTAHASSGNTPASAAMQRLKAAQESGWNSLGTATMQDGWFFPYFGYEFTRRNIISFEMQESVAEPGLYRLVAPYSPQNLEKAGLSGYNISEETADIYIDAIDPEYIMVLGQYSGWKVPGGMMTGIDEDSEIYIGSSNAYMESAGVDMSAIKAMAYGGKFIDGVITVRGCMWGTDPDVAPGGVWSNRQTMFDTRIALPGYSLTPVYEQGTWKNAGTATITDGWFGPRCGEYAGVPYEVAVERNIDRDGIYRLVNPFTSSAASAMKARVNEGPEPEGDYYLTIDLSNPEIVSIPVQPSGIMVEGLSILIGNYVGYVSETFNWDYATSAEFITNGYNGDYVDKVEDGVITVKCPAYGVPGTFRYEFYWPNAEEFMPTVINLKNVLSSVNEIDMENASQPEYYTLQGIRVTNPTPGSIVIRKTANKAEKIMIR